MKKINLLVFFVILGVFAIGRMVFADNSILSVSSGTTSTTVGKTFNASIQINPKDNTVCVVKGTLVFNNLSCQSISVPNGLMVQTNPTCSSPSFVIGIPQCTKSIENLISLSLKGSKAGQGSLSFINTNIIGVGTDVPFEGVTGIYTFANQVTEEVVLPKTTTPTPAEVETKETPKAPETVTPEKTQLFDVVFKIENSLLDKSSDLVSNTNFTSFGNVPTLVYLNYSIRDSNKVEVFSEKDEVLIETEKNIRKDFTGLNLEKGNYVLVLNINYGDNVKDEFIQNFEITNISADEGKASLVWMWILIVVIIGGFIIFKLINRKKENRKY